MRIRSLSKKLLRLAATSLLLSVASTSASAYSGSGSSRQPKQRTAAPIASDKTGKAVETGLAELEHERVVNAELRATLASKDETIGAQQQVIALQGQQLKEKDTEIAALKDADKASQAKATSAEKSLADCQQDRQRVAAERDSARKQNWLFAAVGAVVVAVLKGSN